MTFLKKLFKTDPNASGMEKFVTYIAPIGGAILFLWLYGSCLGIFTNATSRSAETAPNYMVVIGFILLIFSIFWAWWNWSDRIPFRVNETAATLILFASLTLSVAFFCNFWSTDYRAADKVGRQGAEPLPTARYFEAGNLTYEILPGDSVIVWEANR